jgi:cadmium resistance protein CadD (predicted permease)
MSGVFLQVFTVTALTFMSTNTDNLVIYTGFLSSKQGSKVSMVLAYYVSMSVLLLIIFGLSLFFSKIPAEDVKYLGIILSLVGLFLLLRHLLKKDQPEHHAHFESRSHELMLGVTMLMDSFDTTSVFVPLFADSNESSDVAVGGSFILCFIIWGLSGLYISRLRIFKFLTDHKDIVTPIIMILVGIYIFMNTAGDVE